MIKVGDRVKLVRKALQIIGKMYNKDIEAFSLVADPEKGSTGVVVNVWPVGGGVINVRFDGRNYDIGLLSEMFDLVT